MTFRFRILRCGILATICIAWLVGCSVESSSTRDATSSPSDAFSEIEKQLNKEWKIEKKGNLLSLRPAKEFVFVNMMGADPHTVRKLAKISNQSERQKFLQTHFRVHFDFRLDVRKVPLIKDDVVTQQQRSNRKSRQQLLDLVEYTSTFGMKFVQTPHRQKLTNRYNEIWKKIQPLPLGKRGNQSYMVSWTNWKNAKLLGDSSFSDLFGAVRKIQRILLPYETVRLRNEANPRCQFNLHEQLVPATCPW